MQLEIPRLCPWTSRTSTTKLHVLMTMMKIFLLESIMLFFNWNYVDIHKNLLDYLNREMFTCIGNNQLLDDEPTQISMLVGSTLKWKKI